MKLFGYTGKLYRSQLVEVKSLGAILLTLDSEGKLDGMPFMPEMVAFCGRQIRVHRRADRTCVAGKGFHRMVGTVFLQESRCDGSQHDGCNRGCLLFWKEVWLMPADERGGASAPAVPDDKTRMALENLTTRQRDRYVCQSTELATATSGAISRWDFRPLLREVVNGDLTFGGFVTIAGRAVINRLFGRRCAGIPSGTEGKKSKGDLSLRAGEWVRVKNANELHDQLDLKHANLGLAFQPTMTGAIGGQYRVAFPVHRIINEQTGKMVRLQSTVALDGVLCEGTCAANCPRQEYLFWRESWLDRPNDNDLPLPGA